MSEGRKLIEFALPLDAINDASAHDKMPGIGPHPKNLHQWWARLPLPCARAVIAASLIDDPSADARLRGRSAATLQAERDRLLNLIRDAIAPPARRNPAAIEALRTEIDRSCVAGLPDLLDPFAGGGSIPLEGQRLGLQVHAQDLNPVAVLVTKVSTDVIARFANVSPVAPDGDLTLDVQSQPLAAGLAKDVRFYGEWICRTIRQELGDLYSPATLPRASGGGHGEVIAYFWGRLAKCPNPACGAWTPMVHSFSLSTRAKRRAWVEPAVDRRMGTVTFSVRAGDGSPMPGTKQRSRSRCLFCSSDNISDAVLRQQAANHGLRLQLMAVYAETPAGRTYLDPTAVEDLHIEAPAAEWLSLELPSNARWFSPPGYGLTTYRDLFTGRQLVTLTRIAELIGQAQSRVFEDALKAGFSDSDIPLDGGGTGAKAYAEALTILLALALDRCLDYNNSMVVWKASGEQSVNLFNRQAIPMTWDFPEPNLLGEKAVSWHTAFHILAAGIEATANGGRPADVRQADATRLVGGSDDSLLVSTDPPYYDNIGYADLADFFYVWERRVLGGILPDLFSTVLTPKKPELIGSPYRFGGDRRAAKEHFETGLREALVRIKPRLNPRFPMTLYYAFKQSEDDGQSDDGPALTSGWETMLSALLASGFRVIATWPVRASSKWRMVARETNALASYIVLVCRPRSDDAPLATRKEFLSALRSELPEALRQLQRGSIAPVDLAQAAIGPGMAVFSRFSKVVEADGSQMRVREALAAINQALDETLSEQEADFDSATRWALAWFESYGTLEGDYGVAETLSKAKNTAVDGLARDGFLTARAGKVRLLGWEELNPNWDPATDKRLTIWEVTHYLIRAHQDPDTGSEQAAAELLKKVGHAMGETARDLAYRLYSISERKGWAKEALAYNALVVAWPEIARLAAAGEGGAQTSLGV